MSARHTPGPWVVDDEYVCASSAPGLGLCSVMNMDVGGDKGWLRGPITDANARLMAAAPDLLDGLKSLLNDTQHSEHDCGDPKCPVAYARAAVAKAEGRA